MKLKIINLVICLSFVIIGCKNKESSPELENHFTESQIEDLDEIHNFFISTILKSENENFLIVFDNYLNNSRAKGIDAINDTMEVEDFDKIINSISKSTFDEIWEIRTGENIEKKTKYNWLAPKYNGKYQMFLKDFSEKNEIIKKYYTRMIASGDFSPGLFNESLVNSYKKLDYDSKEVQIILAIHYFSTTYDYLNINKTTIE